MLTPEIASAIAEYQDTLRSNNERARYLYAGMIAGAIGGWAIQHKRGSDRLHGILWVLGSAAVGSLIGYGLYNANHKYYAVS